MTGKTKLTNILHNFSSEKRTAKIIVLIICLYLNPYNLLHSNVASPLLSPLINIILELHSYTVKEAT